MDHREVLNQVKLDFQFCLILKDIILIMSQRLNLASRLLDAFKQITNFLQSPVVSY